MTPEEAGAAAVADWPRMPDELAARVVVLLRAPVEDVAA